MVRHREAEGGKEEVFPGRPEDARVVLSERIPKEPTYFMPTCGRKCGRNRVRARVRAGEEARSGCRQSVLWAQSPGAAQ